MGDASQIDALVERLTGAKTFRSVKLQRTQRVSDQEVSYAIEAEPVERFYEAFAAVPTSEREAALEKEDARADEGDEPEAADEPAETPTPASDGAPSEEPS